MKREAGATEIVRCENVNIYAREITYWGRIDETDFEGGSEIALRPSEYPIAGVTLVLDKVTEVNVEQVAVIDLAVVDNAKELKSQVVGSAEPFTIDLGRECGRFTSLTVNGKLLEGASISGSVLTIPVSAFSASDCGEKDLILETVKDGEVYSFNIKATVVTNVIRTGKDIKDYIQTNGVVKNRYGYVVFANDIDFNNEVLSTGNYAYQGGFVGTIDGMKHKLINYSTANDGLFVAVKDSTIKNFVFENVTHNDTALANVFADRLWGTTIENVTINVKSSAVSGKPNVSAGTTDGRGFIAGREMRDVTLKNVTINADGLEIGVLFGYWLKRSNTGREIVVCENVTVTASKVYYLGRYDGEFNDSAISASEALSGLTINQGV